LAAAEQGHPHGQFSVGRYYAGWGDQRDFVKARFWLSKFLANEPFDPSVAEMAERYWWHSFQKYFGHRSTAHLALARATEDETDAFKHMLKSAEYGNPFAMEAVAEAYETGKGVEKNADKAKEWRQRAAESRAEKK